MKSLCKSDHVGCNLHLSFMSMVCYCYSTDVITNSTLPVEYSKNQCPWEIRTILNLAAKAGSATRTDGLVADPAFACLVENCADIQRALVLAIIHVLARKPKFHSSDNTKINQNTMVSVKRNFCLFSTKEMLINIRDVNH